MSWCLIESKVLAMETDIDEIFYRTGGRMVDGMDQEPFVTTAELQVYTRRRRRL